MRAAALSGSLTKETDLNVSSVGSWGGVSSWIPGYREGVEGAQGSIAPLPGADTLVPPQVRPARTHTREAQVAMLEGSGSTGGKVNTHHSSREDGT